MYYINHEQMNKIPFLEIAHISHQSKPLPTVFFIHGFTSAKEHNLHYAYYLAEKGFRVVMPDCHLHGERSKDLPIQSLTIEFWNIVIRSIEELQVLYQHFMRENKIEGPSIGLAGTSMGAIITLGAITKYDWVETAVSLMGNPAYIEFAKQQINTIKNQGIPLPISEEQIEAQLEILKGYDLSLQPELLKNRPLMFWHGEKDPTVPFTPAFEFYERVKGLYSNHEKLHFYRETKADHKVSREGVLRTIEWFEKHLKGAKLFSTHKM